MDKVSINEFVNREPFEPFRLRLSSGDIYDIRNPGLVVPMTSRLLLALAGTDRYVVIPYSQIAAVELLANGSSQQRRKRSR